MYKNLTIVTLIGLFFASQISADSHTDPDFNDDGTVNSIDYALFLAQWATKEGDTNWNAKFDLNSDGIINSVDYALFIADWGKTFPVTSLTPREVLVALYNATGGANWTHNTNWLSDKDISTWHGVSVSNGRVTDLNLSLNNLTGTIPAELGNLTNLETLNLSYNQLRGAIPAELGNLGNLEQLWLVNNQLRGTIPAALGNLSNLEVLILNNNLLSGALPQGLTGLTKLMSFSFGGTSLCAPLDAAFQTWLQGVADTDGSNCSG